MTMTTTINTAELNPPLKVNPATAHITEFVCVWFDSTQQWRVMFDDGSMLPESFGCTGKASGAAMVHLGRGEASFLDYAGAAGDFCRWVKDDDYWEAT